MDATPPDPDQPLLLNDAGRILRLGEDRVRTLADAGILKVERTPGGLRIFRRADVERVAAERAKHRAETKP
jgi:hypothetical protein